MATNRNRASVSLLAIVFIVLGAVLASSLCSTMSSAVAVARNQDASRQAALAAESGLDYLNVMLPRVSSDAIITGLTPKDIIDGLRAALPGQLSGNPAITGATGSGTIGIGSITTETRSGATWSFVTTIETLRTAFDPTLINPDFRARVVGSYTRGGVITTRTIGMDIKAVSMAHPNTAGFGILARGEISLPRSANGGVFLYDNGSLNVNREGTAHAVQGGSVVTFDGQDPPSSVTLPTYPALLYEKLNGYTEWSTPTDGSLWKNVEIPANTNLTITRDLTIEGVLYVRYPSSITFGSDSTKIQTLTIHGAIIWEPGPAPLTTQTIALGKYIGINTDAAPVRDTYLSTVLGDDASRSLLNGDIIAAPQTNLSIDSGDDVTGIKVFNGSLHVLNVNAAGSGNVLLKAPTTGGMVLNNGGIVAEGNVVMTGNSVFCTAPPEPGSMILDRERYRLAFAQATYWEP